MWRILTPVEPIVTKLGTLLAMLEYQRPAGSVTEQEFITRFIRPLPDAWCDNYDNWHVIINAPDDRPNIIWSCHTDTVHDTPGKQTIAYSADTGVVRLSKRSKRLKTNCLGADDTAGVFLCVMMIDRGVPGHYIFHYGEECGGIGSNAIADYNAEVLDATIAIALDRRGTSDIITSQFGSCASADFADSLGSELTRCGLDGYRAARGVFTDTAHYTHVIAECSNLSVGYEHAHSSDEYLNVRHVFRLLDALVCLDSRNLTVSRTPEPHIPMFYYSDIPSAVITIPSEDASDWSLCECGHRLADHDTRNIECARCLCAVFSSIMDDDDGISVIDTDHDTDGAWIARESDYLDPEFWRAQHALRYGRK
jgi:hypothetical protein